MFSSLNSKFIVPTILIVSGIIGTSAWMTLQSHRAFLVDLNTDRLYSLIKSVELQVIDLMLDKHGANLQDKIEQIDHSHEVTAVRIFDGTGTVRCSHDRADLGKTLEDFGLEPLRTHGWSTVFEIQRNGQRSYAMAEPIVNRPICHACHSSSNPMNGFLYIETSFTQTEKQLSSLGMQTLAYTGFTIIILSLLIWILVSRLITRPVGELIERMVEAQSGDFSARVHVSSRDELGALGRTYNKMLERLSTARKELETLYRQQIQRADRLASLGELATSIAHEIKNPLAGISGAIQILKEDYPPGETKRGVLEEILKQIQRLDKTTKDLLSFSRPSPPLFAKANINSLIGKVLSLIEPQARKQRVEIVTHLDENLPETLADEEQIQQALLNICLNGIQAMPDGGRLTMRTEARYHLNSDIILITIEDTGPGIPSDHLSRIFDPFFTTKSQGTGLGLSIAKGIIEGHDGGIFVETKPDKGTVFYFRLPVRKPTNDQEGTHHA